MTATLAAAGIFTTRHIAATAAITGALAFAGALLLLRRHDGIADSLGIGVVAAVAVFLWRKSANMPQLNDDGLAPFSANDWLAPLITMMLLGLYGSVRHPVNMRRFVQAGAVAVVLAFAVNVITI